MKKEEAKILSIQRSKLVIEYINQIFADELIVNSKIKFNDIRVGGQSYLVLDINVPERNFDKHINLGITIDHSEILYEQLFNDIINSFLTHESIEFSKYFERIFMVGENFYGIIFKNLVGSEISLNFLRHGSKFKEITSSFNQKLDDLINKNIDITQNESKGKHK